MIKVRIFINYQNKENMNEVLNKFERLNCDVLQQKRSSGRICLFRHQLDIRRLFTSLVCILREEIVGMLENL